MLVVMKKSATRDEIFKIKEKVLALGFQHHEIKGALSGGERFQVLAAALAAKAGWTMEAVQERLAKIRSMTEVVYTLDTLEYLARGGRIGRVKAMAGALLHLKPVIPRG